MPLLPDTHHTPLTHLSRIVKNPVNGKDIRYYEIEIKEFSANVYPDRGNATLVGYDGVSPGPTFMMERDTEAVVRFVNKAKPANSVHLHGSYSVCLFPRAFSSSCGAMTLTCVCVCVCP